MFDFGFIDAHCHLADSKLQSELDDDILKQQEIVGFISSALCQSEFNWHQNNQNPKMYWVAGIHPTYEKSKIEDLSTIIQLCETKQIIGIGEIGLDVRANTQAYQRKVLLEQLAIAKEFELPVIFHVV
ncbi:MAG: TatD family hydrolase, partial [Candidatus Cloacimonetes bacterium]|nr:TatD family hydrolase [Candidatus Cloacimonadota bacterium]